MNSLKIFSLGSYEGYYVPGGSDRVEVPCNKLGTLDMIPHTLEFLEKGRSIFFQVGHIDIGDPKNYTICLGLKFRRNRICFR
jgi:hypothetical protein